MRPIIQRTTPVIITYVISLVATIALLVGWVVYVVTYVVRSRPRINELADTVGMPQERFHYLVLAAGCTLGFLMLVGLTYQLAQTLAARRYLAKQQEFLSTVTHELRTPLAAIRLHAQTLEEGGLDADGRQQSIGFILDQVGRMQSLVENLLVSSHLAARRRILELEPVALGPFFERYLDEVSKRIEAQGVRLSAQIATDATVLATADALARVMNNLLDNAVRFSSRGGEVRCRVEEAAGRVSVQVEDDGVGIPKKELSKVFDRFHQLGRELGGRRQGAGLGLSIVSGLVREMGGSVRAFSHEGRPGSRFVVEIPVAEAAA